MARAYVTSTYRIPPELHERLEAHAKGRGLSKNECVIALLERGLDLFDLTCDVRAVDSPAPVDEAARVLAEGLA